jgi:hypothetical protein
MIKEDKEGIKSSNPIPKLSLLKKDKIEEKKALVPNLNFQWKGSEEKVWTCIIRRILKSQKNIWSMKTLASSLLMVIYFILLPLVDESEEQEVSQNDIDKHYEHKSMKFEQPRPQILRRPVEYIKYVKEGYIQPDEVRDEQRLFVHPDLQEFTEDDFRKLVQKTYAEPNDPFPYVDDLVKAYTKYDLK